MSLSLALLLHGGCDRPLSFDAQGQPHGSGEKVLIYPNGAIKLREQYENGVLVQSRWFKPDGALIQQTNWVKGTGQGIYLREDGSVKRRMHYVNGIAEGESSDYDEAGNVIAGKAYRAGVAVEEAAPK